MCIYLIIWICVSYLISQFCEYANSPKAYNYFCAFFAYIVYIVFAVFRKIDFGLGGADAMAYYSFFYNATMPYITYVNSMPVEIGFSSLLWILHQLTTNYLIVLWVFHSFTFIYLLKFVKYIKCQNMLAIMLLTQILYTQFYTLRMSICIVIALNILLLMDKKCFLRAIIGILCAISIHKSALIMLPVFVTNYYFKDRKINLLGVSLFICLFVCILLLLSCLISF